MFFLFFFLFIDSLGRHNFTAIRHTDVRRVSGSDRFRMGWSLAAEVPLKKTEEGQGFSTIGEEQNRESLPSFVCGFNKLFFSYFFFKKIMFEKEPGISLWIHVS